MPTDSRLLPHNLQWQSRGAFLEGDPALRRLRSTPLVDEPDLVSRVSLHTPGLYTLVGGRQVGKSTLVKQLMQRLLVKDRVPPEAIAYVTCEPFVDAEELRRVLTDLLASMPGSQPRWLFLDEVTYVAGWDRTIKFLADAGNLERCFVLLTGSDHLVIQDSLKRLPGRRGRADEVDFHLRPLSFLGFCSLRKALPTAVLTRLGCAPLAAAPGPADQRHLPTLLAELRAYHQTGGFLVAINDVARDGVVAPATLRIYADWIRGDVLRLDRSERYLREVLQAITDRYGSQVTWNALASELSIDHPKTIADYVAILARMDAVLVVPALAEHARGPAPKKARKVFFADPFIHRAVRAWLGEADAGMTDEARLQRDLEATVTAHVARAGEVFYLKAKGEVDAAWYEGRRLNLVEVKWARQLRPEELKEIRRRGHGVVAAQVDAPGEVDGVTVLPAALVLLRLAARADGVCAGESGG